MKYYIKLYPYYVAHCTSENENLDFAEHNELEEDVHYVELTKEQHEARFVPAKPVKTAQQLINIRTAKAQKEIDNNKERLKNELVDKQIKVDAMKKLALDATKEEAELTIKKQEYNAL